MHKMKAAARAEANEEDDEVKSAGSDVEGPVLVRAIEVPDDRSVTRHHQHQGQEEANTGEAEIIVNEPLIGHG